MITLSRAAHPPCFAKVNNFRHLPSAPRLRPARRVLIMLKNLPGPALLRKLAAVERVCRSMQQVILNEVKDLPV